MCVHPSDPTPSASALTLVPAFPVKCDKKTLTVVEDSAVPSFDTLEDLADDLPSNSPRYIVVSYELTDPKDGRVSRPLFALNYNPGSGAPEMKTLHASGLSLFQRAADVARVRRA